MAGGFGESASRSPQSPSCSSNNANGDAGENHRVILGLNPSRVSTFRIVQLGRDLKRHLRLNQISSPKMDWDSWEGWEVHGFPDAAMFGAAAGYPYGFSNSYHGGHAHGYHHHHHHHHHHYALSTWVASPAWSVGTADRADLKALVSCQESKILVL
ncbi:hypothetical protein QQP08_023710 [Theobroma cacao]|nr:hypothetical protein QQP08_023710 [Theobroma cacao]